MADLAKGLSSVWVPAKEDANLLQHRLDDLPRTRSFVLWQPSLDLPLELLEVKRAHEEKTKAENDVDHRGDVDGDGVVRRLADVLSARHARLLFSRPPQLPQEGCQRGGDLQGGNEGGPRPFCGG